MLFEERRLRWLVAFLVYLVTGAFLLALHALGAPRVPLVPLFAGMVVAAFCSGPVPALTLLLVTAAAAMGIWGRPIGVLWPIATALDWVLITALFLAGLLSASWFGKVLRKVRQHQQHLDMALSVAHMTSWEWELATNRFTIAPNAQEVLGGVPTSLENLFEMMCPEDLDECLSGLREALRSDSTYTNLARYSRPELGKVRWIETHSHIQRNSKGEPLRMSGVSMDVTDKQVALRDSQQAEERLQKEAQRKDAFLATLAHELRNPMAPIRYAVAMLRPEFPAAKREQAREIIERQSSHIARLLDDLLDMSRIIRNAIELRREFIDLRQIVEHAVENVRHSNNQLSHHIKVSLPDFALPVNGDVTRLQQVVENLLDNAAKYSDPGTEIALCARVEGAEAVLLVQDQGVGIPTEQQGEIFELFTQLRPGRGGGLGIGLTVIKQLVQLHGGSVAVRSEGPGCGSEFSIRLPLAEASRNIKRSAGELKMVRPFDAARTVLVVDDNVDATESLAIVLREMGYSVRTAFDGAGALRVYEEMKPALVLLDIGLPDMTGYAVARAFRKRGFVGALVAITGWGQERDRRESAAAGFDLHLTKPLDPHELQGKLTEMMEVPRAA